MPNESEWHTWRLWESCLAEASFSASQYKELTGILEQTQ